MKKIIKRFCFIVATIMIGIVCLVMLWAITHHILTWKEKRELPEIGEYVCVNGNNMSLCIMGEGEHTIVLLPGLGTVSPILDFMPLAERLAQENKVVIVEPFGYGLSDTVSKERSIENEVEELRLALQAAQVEEPYILMPHSLYGLHTIYYANQYPDEVEAVIGIDCTLPGMTEYFNEEYPAQMSPLVGQLPNMGVMRIIGYLAPDNFGSNNAAGYYSEENLSMQRKIGMWKASNRNVVDQSNHIEDSINKTINLTFDEKMPLLFFTTKAEENEEFFRTYITNESLQQVVILEGEHYLHWTCAEEMHRYVQNFIDQ